MSRSRRTHRISVEVGQAVGSQAYFIGLPKTCPSLGVKMNDPSRNRFENVTIAVVFAAIILILSSTAVSAQTPKRLDLSTSPAIVWEERVPANSRKEFVFYAKKGQKLSISMIDDTGAGSLDFGKVSIEPNAGPLTDIVPISKDYFLTVTNSSSRQATFRIGISLEDPAPTSQPAAATSAQDRDVRVRFSRGETSAQVTHRIAARGSVNFLINARRGQTLGFTVGYDFSDRDLNIYLLEPGGQDFSLTAAAKEPKEFAVKKTGDHTISVTNTTARAVTITLYADVNDDQSNGNPSNSGSSDASITGFFNPKGTLPANFSEIGTMSFSTVDIGGDPIPLRGFIRLKSGTDLEIVDPEMDGDKIEFKTTTVGGVRYHFNGTFTRTDLADSRPRPTDVVLKGFLSKIRNGKFVQEIEVSFTYKP